MIPLLALALLALPGRPAAPSGSGGRLPSGDGGPWPAVPSPFTASIRPLPACRGGRLIVSSFRFNDAAYRRAYTFVVFHDGYKTVRGAAAALLRRGLIPVGLINGGFFLRDESAILSYYRSSALGGELPRNSPRSPRACMVFFPPAYWWLLQSTPANYRLFGSLPEAEVYCAGPQVVEDGRDVSARQLCAESFDPRCRPDGSDPGIKFHSNTPRSASCMTLDGDLKFFSANSGSAKCGMTGPELARAMAAEGCHSGMNHDGGGSAKLYLWDMRVEPLVAAGYGEDRLRASPVWAAVVRRRR